MTQLPTVDEILANAEADLRRAYVALSDASDWLRSDWSPARRLTAEQSQQRVAMLRAIRVGRDAINEAKR